MITDDNNLIQKGIIKNILYIFGCCNNDGILKQDHITDQTITFLDDDNNKYHEKIISAQTTIDESVFKVAAVDISSNKTEYIVAFRMDDLPIYVVRLNYNDVHDYGDFYTIVNDTIQKTHDIDKYQVIAGIQKLILLNSSWEICNQIDDLKQAIISIIEL